MKFALIAFLVIAFATATLTALSCFLLWDFERDRRRQAERDYARLLAQQAQPEKEPTP